MREHGSFRDTDEDRELEGNALLTRNVLLRDGDVTIEREEGFSEEIVQFLDETVWGTTETLFEHDGTRERLNHLKDPILAVLRSKGQLVATVIIERRNLQMGGKGIKGFFFRYLSSKPSFSNRRLVGYYGRRLMSLIVDSEPGDVLFYASVEGKNYRSFNFLHKLGYREQAAVRTIGYSRFWPRADKRLHLIQGGEKQSFRKVLRTHFQNHTLVHDNHVFQDDGYYVLREGKEIIAGCQVHAATWVLKNIPGRFGNLFLKWLPRIPLINGIFNPERFTFLTLEAIYYQSNRKEELLRLFEALMHLFDTKVILLWVEEKDPMCQVLDELGNYGMMQHFVDEAEVKIMAITSKITPDAKRELRTSPMYISTFDFI